MNKKTVLKNIDNIYNKLNNNYILISSNTKKTKEYNPYLYHTITAAKNYLYYKNFGEYASINTKKTLSEYIKNFFNDEHFYIIPLKTYYNLCLTFSKYQNIKTNLQLLNPFYFGNYVIKKYNEHGYILHTKNGYFSNYFFIVDGQPRFESMLYVNKTTKNKIKTLIKNNVLTAYI